MVECGRHEDLMVRGGKYAQLYEIQASAVPLTARPRTQALERRAARGRSVTGAGRQS
ncbi:MAG: hypothetical protein KatS3mg010_0725 [Acidimicrobiia bacterium]|nr:MAG: hypothetical protein KatS3mg010_0725 [Acidimicrobiia bacterium]